MSGGAQRRPGRAKSGKPRAGTGGKGRRRLEGKGPTPPAHLRPGHPAQRRAAQKAASAARSGGGAARVGADRGQGAGQPRRGDGPEMIAGRNAVLEALQAKVPATALYVAYRTDTDDRIRAAVRLAADAGLAVLESGRG